MTTGLTQLRSGMRTQGLVLGALMLREMQSRHGRANIGYVWAIVEPMAMLALFWLAFTYLGRKSHIGMEIVPFLATGIITFYSVRSTARGLAGAFDSNRGLLLYPQVTSLDLLLARGLLEVATLPVLIFTIIGGAYLIGMSPPPDDFGRVMIALVTVQFLAIGIGLTVGAATMIFPVIDHFMRPFWRIMLWTSCVFYTLDELPRGVQRIIEWNPVAHGIEVLRSGFFVNYESKLASYEYLLGWIVGTLFLGFLFERTFRDRRKKNW